MRKIATLILALCLLLSLSACGGTANPSGTAAPSGTAVQTNTPGTTDAVQDSELRGTLETDAYVNSYLKLRIARPEGWTFYTEEQIAQVNNTTAELFEKTDIADMIAKSGQMMDMMVANAAGNSMNLIIQPNQAALASYSDEQVFQLSEQAMKAQFESAGMSISTFEPKTVQVGGQERTALHMVLSANGAEVDEYQLWFRDQDKYMGILTIALTDGSDPQPILDGITTQN